jgi:hypothetical protein
MHLWLAVGRLLDGALAWTMRQAERDMRRLEADVIRGRWRSGTTGG